MYPLLPELPQDSRVLIVDDDRTNLRLMKAMLARYGNPTVTDTSDAAAVLDLAHRERPELVMLDLHMGPVSGFAALRALREAPDIDDNLPIIVVTGDQSDYAVERAPALARSM
jgi:CheY-like chemotaxis protein